MSPLFGELAPRLADNNFTPLPIRPGTKRPAINKWSDIDYVARPELLEALCRDHANASIGILLGSVSVVDIDVLNEKLAHHCQRLVTNKLGDAPCRVGQSPKRALFFRVEGEPFSKLSTRVYEIEGTKAQVEILCNGQQIVVFGIHPDTGQPYSWTDSSLLDLDIEQLPTISRLQADTLVREIETEFASLSDISFPELSPPRSNVSIGTSSKTLDGRTAEITEALGYLDSQDYHEWVATGHALKSAGNDYRPIFIDWSKRRTDGSIPRNFVSDTDVNIRWESFKPDRTSLASLFRRAAAAGWKGNTVFTLNSGSHTEIARYILAHMELNEPHPVYAVGELWQFRKTSWQPVADHEQRKMVHALDGLRCGNNRHIRVNKSLVDGVLTELHAICAEPDFFNDAPIGLNCLSGFIRITQDGGAALISHAPELKQKFCIDAIWTPDANAVLAPLTERFFSGICGVGNASRQTRILLEEILGAACAVIATRIKAPKAFVLFGPSAANGKSQFIELVRGMLPPGTHSSIAPSEMGKEQFLAELSSKAANLSDELSSSKAISSAKMKAVISGDVVSAKRVYKPVYQFKPRALHLFATNSLPPFQNGADEGIRRRFVVVPFNQRIPEKKRIPEISKRILQCEKDAVLALAVAGACRVLKSGSFSIPQWMIDETEQWFRDADNANAWLDDGGIERLLRHRKHVSFDDAFRAFREDINERDAREWVPPFSSFRAMVRAYIDTNPELEIVRHAGGYKIVERLLV